MATYKIKWLENKNPDWKILTLDDNGTEIRDVSVNRVNKKGETFPNFDEITNAGTVEGELWKSDAGKNYLFAPKPQKAGNGGAFKTMQMEKTMGIKAEHIAHAQDEKAYSIKVASTFTAAWNTAVAEWQEQRRTSPSTAQTLEALFEKWREWYWLRFDVNETDYPPMP